MKGALDPFAPSAPLGVRDYAPSDAAAYYALQARLLSAFEAQGYARVMTPAFELAEVFERGLSAEEANRLLRFTDPQTGDALVLRSDITPQIARLVCGAIADATLPLRLCYFGRVFRLRQHTEFQRREVAQAGIELIGAATLSADAEAVRLCEQALRSTGLEDFVMSIGHVGILEHALRGVPAILQSETRTHLHRKDAGSLAECLHAVDEETRALLCELVSWHGHPDEVLARAASWAEGSAIIAEVIEHLTSLRTALGETAERCLLDLGQMQGFGYYTGLVFHAWAKGVGTALASGGRYDNLIGRYGRDLPAVGFAIDEESITAALSPAAGRA